MRYPTLLAFIVLAAACGGGGSSPTSPPPTPTIPNVAGNYSGSATFNFPELATTLTCPASTSVTQSGSTVNVAPIILTGQCQNISIPFGQATIDNTGNLGGSQSGSYNEPSCGTYNYTGSGGFFGRDLRISLNATSRTCYNFNFTATLTR